MVQIRKTFLSTTAPTLALALALVLTPSAAHAQLIGNLDNNTVLGGAIGAGLGGVIGSNLAPNGQGDEYTAIGAVAGGLAGAAYGNSRSTYAGNPYAGQFNPGFNSRNLVGTAIGAGVGGAIGSNLAGSGQRQEGTAIGAVLGGIAGYSLANSSAAPRYAGPAYNGPLYGGGYTGGAYIGGNGHTPYVGRPVYAPPQYTGSTRYFPAPAPSRAPLGHPAPGPFYGPLIGPNIGPVLPTAPGTVHRGEYVAGPVIPVTSFVRTCGTTCAPVPKIRVQREIIRKERIVVDADCPQGTSEQADGTCLAAPKKIYQPAPTVIPAECPAGTTDQGNGTCLEPAKTVMGQAPIVIAQNCPVGTTDQGDGTCLEPAKTIIGQAPVVVEQHCPVGTTDQGNGTCLSSPKVILEPAPLIRRAPDPELYCYSDSHKRYDRNGNLIGYEGYDYESGRCKELY